MVSNGGGFGLKTVVVFQFLSLFLCATCHADVAKFLTVRTDKPTESYSIGDTPKFEVKLGIAPAMPGVHVRLTVTSVGGAKDVSVSGAATSYTAPALGFGKTTFTFVATLEKAGSVDVAINEIAKIENDLAEINRRIREGRSSPEGLKAKDRLETQRNVLELRLRDDRKELGRETVTLMAGYRPAQSRPPKGGQAVAVSDDLVKAQAILREVVPEHPDLKVVDTQEVRDFKKDSSEDISRFGSIGQTVVFGDFKGDGSSEVALCVYGPIYEPLVNDKDTRPEDRHMQFRDIYLIIAEKMSTQKWKREWMEEVTTAGVGRVPFVIYDSKARTLHYGLLLEDPEEGSIAWDKLSKKFKYTPTPWSGATSD